MTNNWESWAYTWTLIPGFADIGIYWPALIILLGLWMILRSLITNVAETNQFNWNEVYLVT